MASSTLAQSAISSNPDVVIGVDTHKDIHVAVALAPNAGRLGECRIPTTRKGYDELIAWTEQFGYYTPLFAMEGTGSFGAGLCRELADAGFPVVEVNRPDRSTRRRLGGLVWRKRPLQQAFGDHRPPHAAHRKTAWLGRRPTPPQRADRPDANGDCCGAGPATC